MSGRPYALSLDMMWKIDPQVTAAEKLPKWARFHRACGEKQLCFDKIEKSGRGFKCVAFRIEGNSRGGWTAFHVADGSGKSPLDAIADAFATSGYDIPEAAALLAAGLRDAPVAAEPDDFDALMDDDFEELLR